MRKRSLLLIAAVLITLLCVSILTGCGDPSAEPTAPAQATPDSPTYYAIPNTPPVPPMPPATEPPADDTNTEPDVPADEELDFFEAFSDYPAHFVTHGGRPSDDGPSDYYLHATLEIAADGTMTGELFSNLESTENEVIEQKSNWTGRIADNKVYRREDGSYYFYVTDIQYEKEPGTIKQKDDKVVKYVNGFGLDPSLDNMLELFTPGTDIDSLVVENAQQDVRQFLTMMRKEGTDNKLECYLLRGRVDNCYISLTEEEASMGPPQEPQKPDGP